MPRGEDSILWKKGDLGTKSICGCSHFSTASVESLPKSGLLPVRNSLLPIVYTAYTVHKVSSSSSCQVQKSILKGNILYLCLLVCFMV